MLKQINGILLPGGRGSSVKNMEYLPAAKVIYELAVEMNNNGDYFPIWGTCLGFEFLLYITAKEDQDPRRICPRIRKSLRLKFTPGFKLSRMFKDIKQNVVDILATQRVTFNNHRYCITQADIQKCGLEDDWQETSISCDSRGYAFISTIEHRKYPFYGVQFHPEKNAYEFTYKNINHSTSAIQTSRSFAFFFVDECRKNRHCFSKESDQTRHLIYNFPMTFARKKKDCYTQVYLFKEHDDYRLDLPHLEFFYDVNDCKYVQYFCEGVFNNS